MGPMGVSGQLKVMLRVFVDRSGHMPAIAFRKTLRQHCRKLGPAVF